MWIELSETERKLATFIAKARYTNNRTTGVIDRKIGPQDNEATDLEGIGSEIAFCKLHNVYPDLEIDHRPDHDALLRTGQRVDVKGTKYNNGHLLAIRGKTNKPPDVYALMVGQFPKYRFAGFIPAEELLQEVRLKDFGYGLTFAAGQDDLDMFIP